MRAPLIAAVPALSDPPAAGLVLQEIGRRATASARPLARSRAAVLAIVIAVVVALAAVPAAEAAPPVLVFEERAVVAKGVTPGGRVGVFGAGRGFNGFVGYLVRDVQVAKDEDGDGLVRVELEFPVPLFSVWAAVDLGSGELSLGAPSGVEVREVAFPRGAIGASGLSLSDERRYLYALWVRPEGKGDSGVWFASFGDGSESDGDGVEDLSVQALVTAFVAVEAEGAEAPERLTAGDVVVGMDPETLEIYAARLAG